MVMRTGSQRNSRGPVSPSSGSFTSSSVIHKPPSRPSYPRAPMTPIPCPSETPSTQSNHSSRRRSIDPPNPRLKGTITMATPPVPGKKPVKASTPLPSKLNIQTTEEKSKAKTRQSIGILTTKTANLTEETTENSRISSIRTTYQLTPSISHPNRSSSVLKRDYIDTSSVSQSTSDSMNPSLPSKTGESRGIGEVKGLRNFGNACYMNAIVQCLAHLPGFGKGMEGGKEEVSRLGKSRGGIYRALMDVFAELRSERQSFPSVISLKSALSVISPQFLSYDQHDSHEFLRLLLSSLHDELNRVLSPPPGLKLTRSISSGNDMQTLAEIWWKDSLSRGNSVVTDLFQGQLVNTLKCSRCGNCKYTFDAFWDLSVSIPEVYTLRTVNLTHCLDDFTCEKLVEGVKCKVCGSPQNHKATMKVNRFPPLLVVHLKRFAVNSVGGMKVNTPVLCPLKGLDMGKYGLESGRRVYELSGVVHHYGDVDFGHYFS